MSAWDGTIDRKIDWRRPLMWADTGNRAFIRGIFDELDGSPRYLVDDVDGTHYVVNENGICWQPVSRVLVNTSHEADLARERLRVKKAQERMKRERELYAAEQLANLNPNLFGLF